MKKLSLIIGASLFLLSLNSCSKDECHECHYEKIVNGTEEEVELGEKCGDELEELEADGYTDTDGTNYEVHCHEH